MQGAGSGWSWWGSETVAGAGRIAVLRKVRTYIRLAPKKADLSVSLQAKLSKHRTDPKQPAARNAADARAQIAVDVADK